MERAGEYQGKEGEGARQGTWVEDLWAVTMLGGIDCESWGGAGESNGGKGETVVTERT